MFEPNRDSNGTIIRAGDIVLIAGVRRVVILSRPGRLLRLQGETDAFYGCDMTLIAIAGTPTAREALEAMAADIGPKYRIVMHPATGDGPALQRA